MLRPQTTQEEEIKKGVEWFNVSNKEHVKRFFDKLNDIDGEDTFKVFDLNEAEIQVMVSLALIGLHVVMEKALGEAI
jgi:hypothetical protein